jgi:hypothetical protein
VLESQGEGPNKRTAKEAAARSMLRKMESATGVDRLAPISPLSGVASDIPDVVDHDLDDDITLALSPYSPQYHSWQTPGEVCCLAWVESGGGGKKAYPITGHGRGREESTARREASVNLLSALSVLHHDTGHMQTI